MKVSMAAIRKQFSEDIINLNPEVFGEYERETGKKMDLPTVNEVAQEPKKRTNKYGAHKITIGQEKFDSKAEARRWLDLRDLVNRGEITNLMRQIRICLLDGFDYHGEKVRPIWYTADFIYTKDGITYIEDVKSVATSRAADFRLRWRMLQHLYKDVANVRCVTTGT